MIVGLMALVRQIASGEMHVRKTEIRYWIEQGWLEAVRKDQGRSTYYNISPEALQRCLREHLAELQKRNTRSATRREQYANIAHANASSFIRGSISLVAPEAEPVTVPVLARSAFRPARRSYTLRQGLFGRLSSA
jgi:hypothetical protein